MRFDAERVRRDISQAETSDLVDRITAYRQGMEPEAVEMIEEELRRRGITAEDILARADNVQRAALSGDDGTAARCSFCNRPAVARRWGWHRLWGVVPLFPRAYFYCAMHQPEPPAKQ
jgi:hypothetical protein